MNKIKLLSVLILSFSLTACIEKGKSSIPPTKEKISVKSVLNTEAIIEEKVDEKTTVESDIVTIDSSNLETPSNKEDKDPQEREIKSKIIELTPNKKKIETILETDSVLIEDIEILIPTKKELNSMK